MTVTPPLPAVSLLSVAALAVGAASPPLTYQDAMSALRAVGVTKVFTVGTVSDPAGKTIIVTDGAATAQVLRVRVFPSAKAVRSWVAKNPPAPAALVRRFLPHAGAYAGTYLPRRIVCNVLVASGILPYLTTNHPTAAERRKLDQVLAKIAATQARVVQYLHRRCAS